MFNDVDGGGAGGWFPAEGNDFGGERSLSKGAVVTKLLFFSTWTPTVVQHFERGASRIVLRWIYLRGTTK